MTRIQYFLVLTAILSGIIIRFWNFGNRITFWSEQARSLIISAEYLKHPTLLGQEYFRQTENGHKLFAGAYFNYSLVPLLIISDYDPLAITGYFAILNIVTGIVLFYLVLKIFNYRTALFSLILFLFNLWMIYHSLFIWILNYLPLIGISSGYFIFREKTKKSMINVFLLGLLSGIGFGLEYFYLLFTLPVFCYLLYKNKNILKVILIFITGFILGNLPMFLFDIKHDFYHLSTLIEFATETLKGTTGTGIVYYYFLPLIPVVLVAVAYLLNLLYLKFRYLIFLVLLFYVAFNVYSPLFSFSKPIGMPLGLNYQSLLATARAISQDKPASFNVASTLDFDKRAYVLRYLMQYKYGKSPASVENYANIDSLYVISSNNIDLGKTDIWELNEFSAQSYTDMISIGNGYKLSKLTK